MSKKGVALFSDSKSQCNVSMPLHEGDIDKEVEDQRFLQLGLLPSLLVE